MMQVSFRINGDAVTVDVEPRLHLADCLREVLSLTGTHLGCEHERDKPVYLQLGRADRGSTQFCAAAATLSAI
jgi:aerobic-type carbon monoxide dehydrogenase small subunit (CoxS/CutS family)